MLVPEHLITEYPECPGLVYSDQLVNEVAIVLVHEVTVVRQFI